MTPQMLMMPKVAGGGNRCIVVDNDDDASEDMLSPLPLPQVVAIAEEPFSKMR